MGDLSCYGFGERADNCPNAAGGKWSPFFCPDCDEKRVAHISQRFAEIDARMKARSSAAVREQEA